MSRQDRYERLVERYSAVFGRAVSRICRRRERHLVPDVEQEIRLALWKRLQTDDEIREDAERLAREAGYDEEIEDEILENERRRRGRRREERRKRHTSEWDGEERRGGGERRSGRERRADAERNIDLDAKYGHH